MHGPLRSAYIQRFDTQFCGGNRPDSASATHIGAHHEMLGGNFSLFAKLLEPGRTYAVAGVTFTIALRWAVGITLLSVAGGMALRFWNSSHWGSPAEGNERH